MISDQQKIDVYKIAPEDVQRLYSAPESGAMMYVIFKKFNLDESLQYKIYAEIVGDTILGFNKIADMPRMFQQKLAMSSDESQRLTSSLIEFLAPVVQREETEAQTKKTEMTTLAETLSQPDPKRLHNPEIQKLTENVEPLRTMQTDINRIHGYGAYNAEQNSEAIPIPEEPIQKLDDATSSDPI